MYKIIGSDNLEYGPVSAEVVRQWIAEGRLNAQSRLRAETSPDWVPLAALPEFAAEFAPRVSSAPPLPPISPYSTPAAAAPGTNKLAITGFVFSLFGLPCCCQILSIPGLVLSCIAYGQLRRNPAQGGNGLAIAGIIISIIGILCLIFSTIYFMMNPLGLDQILKNLKN